MTQDNSIHECLTNLEELFNMFFQNGNYEDGISIANDICEIIESDLGITYQKYPYWLNKLAMSYYSIGNYDKAESLYKKALEILLKTVGENNTDYAEILDTFHR